MLKTFDGFIAAVSTETKIPFHGDEEGKYTAELQFDNGRGQKVFVVLDTDEAGDGIVRYYSVICQLSEEQQTLELFRDLLKLSVSFDYGAIGLTGNTLIISQTVMLKTLEVSNFMKSLIYVAAKADELEETFVKVDNA